jgi:hypothetical protein
VIYTNASVAVDYGDRSAYFVDQIVVGQEDWSFAKPGDSGSAVDKDGEFVGLVFAGSPSRAVICKAEHIVEGLDIAVEPLAGQYSLTISSATGGSVTVPGEGRFLYDSEEVVSLEAVSDEHYHFVEWTGDTTTIHDAHAASTTITMNGNYEIIANFELESRWHSLTTSSTEGGSVITPGEGIYVYSVNTTIDLVAKPDEYYRFADWTGDVSTVGNVTAAETTITINDSYSVVANFGLEEGWYSLTISSTDGGSVTQPGEGTFVYTAGLSVPLLAVPEEGYRFVKWTGDVAGITDMYAPSTSVTMDASYSITANFESPHPEPMASLTVSSTTGGAVTVPGEGTFSYPLGAEVSLVAEAASGYRFVNWSGNVGTIADVNDASTSITMDGSYSVIANFSGGGGCFIATAAYSTPMAEEIQALREFRDEYLVSSTVGKALVDFYYTVSPPIAKFITEHPNLKPVVRAGLVPVVAVSDVVVSTSSAEKVATAVLVALISVALAMWAMRRRGKSPDHT